MWCKITTKSVLSHLLWNFPKCNAGVCSRDSFGRYYPSLCNFVCVWNPMWLKKAICHRVRAFFSCTHLSFAQHPSLICQIYQHLLKPLVRLTEFNRLPIRCLVTELGEKDKLAFQKCLVWKNERLRVWTSSRKSGFSELPYLGARIVWMDYD